MVTALMEKSHFSDLNHFVCFSQSLDQFFLTVGQNNFDNKIPYIFCMAKLLPFYNTKLKFLHIIFSESPIVKYKLSNVKITKER